MIAVAALCAGLAAALLVRPAAGPGRLARVCAAPRAAVPARPVLTPAVAAVLGGLGVALVVGGVVGAALGAALAVAGPAGLRRLPSRSERATRAQLVADLPLTLELLAACLAAGTPLAGSAAAVAEAVPGPCGQRLAEVARALAVGTAPEEAWAAFGRQPEDPLWVPSRLLSRSCTGGAPPAQALTRLAADARLSAVAAGEQAARRAGVLVVAPLGLCFLPAFVLLGVVPVVAGLAAPLFAG